MKRRAIIPLAIPAQGRKRNYEAYRALLREKGARGPGGNVAVREDTLDYLVALQLSCLAILAGGPQRPKRVLMPLA